MLILPAEHPLDWKKPPLVTLLLILLNVLVYFGYQGGDRQRLEQAVHLYLDGGLLERERQMFLEQFTSRRNLDLDQRQALASLPRQQLTALLLTDLQFEQHLHRKPAYQADTAWQQARQRAEAARDRISIYRFGFIPAQFNLPGLFAAMFLHGDFVHLASNMLFLFLFGFALEIALGRWRYLALYLLGGVAAHLLWWALDPAWIAGVGASGAVSGLMGMYLGLYGLRRINFFYWLGPLFGYFRAPALWILPVWMGKELYGLLFAEDQVNYYAHLGGMGFGFLAVWLPRRLGRLQVDEGYLHKEAPETPFRRALQALDQTIGRFALEQAASRGLDMLQRYPGRSELLERLYPLALSRQDRPLLAAVLSQLFALPPSAASLALLGRLAADSARQPLLQHPAVQHQLLRGLLRAGQAQPALEAWRRLAQSERRPAELPALTLQLAKQLGRAQPAVLGELQRFLNGYYPDSEQTGHLAQLRRHLESS